jgi:hypothetical protein
VTRDAAIVAVAVVLLVRAVGLLTRGRGARVLEHGPRASRATTGELRAYVASLRLRGVRSPGALAAAFRYRQRHPGGH